MRTSFKLFTILMVGVLVAIPGCDENGEEAEEPGALEGSWGLTDLTATYLRTVATPAGTPTDTSYSLTASWNLALPVLGSASAADQELTSFSAGDTVLGITRAFDAAGLKDYGIALEMEFLEDGTYTLTGTYPTLRVDMAACSTYLAIPQVSDVGNYTITYNAAETSGTLAIAPNDLLGDQVLPSFDDAVVTFTNVGETVQLDFLDRDAHDVLIAQTGETWDETEHRVTMGIPEAPVISALGIFATPETADTTGKSAYLYDPVLLASWGNYLTFYALAIQYETTFLATAGTLTDLDSDGDIDVVDGITYIFLNRDTGTSQLLLPYSLLVAVDGTPTDDSASDFDPTNAAGGGKLTYVINNVCIPVNELIDFETSWDKHEH